MVDSPCACIAKSHYGNRYVDVFVHDVMVL